MSELQTIYYPPGYPATIYHPGDFFLSTNDSLLAKAIRFGERRRFPHEFCWTNHAGRIIDGDGTIIEALSHGLEPGNISKYTERDCVVVSPGFTDAEREKVWQWSVARETEQTKYGYLHILCEALVCLTGTKFRFGMAGQMICSGFVAMGNAEGGQDVGDDPTWMMPAELAVRYKVPAPGVLGGA